MPINTTELIALKSKSGLSNNGWDKDIKGLGELGLTQVKAIDDGLFVEIV
jgi:lysyl-tRNA synthetase class 2